MPSHSQGTFDTNDASYVKHTRLGVWDLYEQIPPNTARASVPRSLERRLEILNDLPYVWRMLKDITSIKSCRIYLIVYLIAEIAYALIPAVSLWYSGQFLAVVQHAIDNKSVDADSFIHVCMGTIVCDFVKRILEFGKRRIGLSLNLKIKQYYSVHIFSSMARLDVPTFDDPLIQRRLFDATSFGHGNSTAWDSLRVLLGLVSSILSLVSQLSVLIAVLRDQRDGISFAVIQFAQTIYNNYKMRSRFTISDAPVWAATTSNRDYVRMEGMKRVVNDLLHRKELVAGNLGEFITNEFRQVYNRIQGYAASLDESFVMESSKNRSSLWSTIFPLQEFPRILYVLRAAQDPKSIPASIASMRLIQTTTEEFVWSFMAFLDSTGSIAEQLQRIRMLYEIENIPNKILDGNLSYPENQQSLRSGISIEFRNVSFKYPHSENHALKNVSFKIEKGQLCVLVGSNGSGKSTILKLIMRLFDPTEGQILIDDQDIKCLKLADLRQAVSVLFQDYTHFPLSIKDNIGLGDPSHAHDEERIREAARLGGAEDFIETLPLGFDTYLDRPVNDYFSNIPEGTKTLFGRQVDFSGVMSAIGGVKSYETTLSGGQMQRLAVSRTFMRSVLSDEIVVGLLLFDEPSASLDPKAEHDLFTRLKDLRGKKTMVFSSHRFGQLTRHADLIIYMNNSTVLETGTHDELMTREGGSYAELWNLQAQAFI